MKRLAYMIAFLFLIGGLLAAVDPGTHAERTDQFYDNSGMTMDGGPVRITEGGGADTSYYFKVGRNVPISEAYLNISTRNTIDGGALQDPYVDIGVDGRSEWEFTGEGYGMFGEQHYFDDDRSRISMNFPSSGGYNSNNDILIPEGAEINEAEINIMGRFIPQSISTYKAMDDPSSVALTGYAMEHGDIDLDGDIDIVVTYIRNDRILWFENPSDMSKKWPVHTVYSGYYVDEAYGLDLGDVDGDGDLDIATTSYNRGYVMYIRNNNKGASWSMYRFYTGFSYAGPVKIADMDLDGNPDFVVAPYYCYLYYRDEFLYWFKAPDDPNTTYGWSAKRIAQAPTYYIYPYLGLDVGDLNADGYPDVAISLYPRYTWYGNYNRVYVYWNPKSGSTWSQKTVDNSAQRAFNLAIGDLTGDGLNDIAAATYDGGKVTLYTNSDNGSSWSESTIGSISYPRYVRIMDFDKDGKNDTIAGGGSGSYELAAFYQGSSSWTKHSITTEVMNPQAFSVFDMDKDGDHDFMASGISASQLVKIETLTTSPPTFNLTWLEDGGVKDIRALDYHDMNSDGKTDIILAGFSTGWIGWMENDDNPYDSPGDLHKIGVIGNPIKVMAADVDGDDDKDIVALSSGGTVAWWENNGDPYSMWQQYIVATGVPSAYSMYAGDFTGDGQADVVTSSAGGYYNCYIRLYKSPTNPKSVTSWSYKTIASGMQYLKNVWADDMDLDGDLDVLAVYGSYGSGAVVYYRNPLPSGTPMSGTWSSVNIGGGMYYPEDVKTIDITDDGYPDVVTTGSYYYSSVRWFESPGPTGGWTGRILYSGSYDWNLAVGDIGDDGYADIVFNRGSYSSPSSVYWYEEPEDYAQSWIGHSLGGYSGTWALGVQDLDNDGLAEIMSTSRSLDEIRSYKINAIYPQDVALDVGGDESSPDWEMSGNLKGRAKIEFKEALQDVVDTVPTGVSRITDKYGTTMLSIPMEVYSRTLGKIALEGISITYNATVRIDRNGEGQKLAQVLDRIIPDHVGSDPYIRVYVSVGARSAGEAYISDLSVEFNAIPRQTKPLPDFVVDEDSTVLIDKDLTEYFRDDYTAPEDLTFKIRLGGPFASKINAYIMNDKVYLDSTLTKDFYTRSSTTDIIGRILVEDDGGPNNVPSRTFYTQEFPIVVKPVNDPPVRTGEVLPTFQAKEGSTVTVGNLNDYDLFFDVDGDKLTYMLVPDLDFDSYDQGADFDITYYPKDGALEVSLSEYSDWTGTVKVRLYATDQPTFNLNEDPFVDFMVDVVNTNDIPYWLDIPDVKVQEDVPANRILELSQYTGDMDTPRSDLKISLIDYTNKSFLTLSTDKTQSGLLYVSFAPRVENWHGRTTASLILDDGEFQVDASFDVIVEPVDDLPHVWINEPIENSRIEPGFFSIVGEANDVEGIDYVEVLYNGEWRLAQGTNSWGVTLEAAGQDEMQESVPIQVRASDGENFAYSYVNITILPLEKEENPDFDGDGYPNLIDAFPFDVSEWSDRDKDDVGDNSDAFPDNPEWSLDSDKDTFADKADTDPFDPELWDDQDRDGRNDFLPPISRQEEDEGGTSYTWPILLFVIAALLLLITVVSLVMFIRKRKASKDPVRMAKYYAKQQRLRERRHELIEKLPLAKIMEKLPGATTSQPSSSLPMPSRPGMPFRGPPGGMRPMQALPPPPMRGGRPPMNRPPGL
ncbi:MAG: FG-GAP-like repeat-containing protein [Thermoplasmatota archaeon]